MNNIKLNAYKPIFISLIVSLVALAIHKLAVVLFFPKAFEISLIYSIPVLYSLFYLFTAIILFVLIEIKKRSIDNVGFTFMFLTSIKMGIAYFLMQPILNSDTIFAFSEKINFFVIFILFLIIETLVTIRILNNKQ